MRGGIKDKKCVTNKAKPRGFENEELSWQVKPSQAVKGGTRQADRGATRRGSAGTPYLPRIGNVALWYWYRYGYLILTCADAALARRCVRQSASRALPRYSSKRRCVQVPWGLWARFSVLRRSLFRSCSHELGSSGRVCGRPQSSVAASCAGGALPIVSVPVVERWGLLGPMRLSAGACTHKGEVSPPSTK